MSIAHFGKKFIELSVEFDFDVLEKFDAQIDFELL